MVIVLLEFLLISWANLFAMSTLSDIFVPSFFQMVYCGVTLFATYFLIISHNFFAGDFIFSFDTY